MTTQTSFGSAQNLRLARTARMAGEAFAFSESENLPVARHASVAWTAAVAFVIALATAVVFWAA